MSSPVSARVFLARHCDVRNPQGVLYGHLPDFPLSEKGVRQAHEQGEYLATTGATVIEASPLLRAQQTAQIIAEHIPGATITTSADLVEARFGLYVQGVKPAQIPWRRPLWMVHMIWPGLLPNDESVGEMSGRVQRSIRRVLDMSGGTGGILVSHGDPIQAFWVRSAGRPAWALHRLQCAKGGMLVLDYVDGRLVNTTYRPPPREPGSAPRGDPSTAGDVV
jgi:broad specificity phosphatase PhoE